MQFSLSRRLVSECAGALILLATVVGSGIMAENLSGGNVAVALLGNTIPTGAILYVLIAMLGPVSGAHFNPAVTLVFLLRHEISMKDAISYSLVQVLGALAGVVLAHAMFDLPLLELSAKARTGTGQWVSEAVATAGLILTILVTLETHEKRVAQSVALYITAAYWFTASTSFANPAVTIARSFSDTFAGIRLADAPAFIVVQCLAAAATAYFCKWFLRKGHENH